jgi:hypothetical protein
MGGNGKNNINHFTATYAPNDKNLIDKRNFKTVIEFVFWRNISH